MSRSSKMSESYVINKKVPVERTNISSFDDSFAFMKEKFQAEMKRMDDAMNKFSEDLMVFYGQETAGNAPLTKPADSPAWQSLVKSPLVHGENLRLQFDLSDFSPEDITVQIEKDVLKINASQKIESDHAAILREFKRNFILPKGVNPNTVVSSFSRDGVLIVEIALPAMMMSGALKEESKVTKEPSLEISKEVLKAPSKIGSKSPMSLSSPPRSDDKGVLPNPARQRPQSPMSPVSPAAPAPLPNEPPKVASKVSKLSTKPQQ